MTTRRQLLALSPAALLSLGAGPDAFAATPAKTTRTVLLGGPLHGRLLASPDELAPDLETGPRPQLAVYAGAARVGSYTDIGAIKFDHDPSDRRAYLWTQTKHFDEAAHRSNVVKVVRVIAVR
jgi:hypothetical protein